MDWLIPYTTARDTLLDLAAADPAAHVPACPAWTARDVVRHVIAVAGDFGRGAIVDNQSEGHVAEAMAPTAGLEVDALRDLWGEVTERIRPWLEDETLDRNRWPGTVFTDLVVHLHDVRGAIGEPDHDDPHVLIATGQLIKLVRLIHGMGEAPPYVISVPGVRDWVVGRGDPQLSLTAGLWDVFRTVGGRRTRAQAEALDWSGDPAAVLDCMLGPQYAFAESPLSE